MAVPSLDGGDDRRVSTPDPKRTLAPENRKNEGDIENRRSRPRDRSFASHPGRSGEQARLRTHCGWHFAIVDIAADGLIELNVGDPLGESIDADHIAFHTIWIEPECIELVESST
jgi:hypothetical protein